MQGTLFPPPHFHGISASRDRLSLYAGTDPIVALNGLPGLIGPQAPSRFLLQELGPVSETLEVQHPFAVPIISPLPQYSLFGDQQVLTVTLLLYKKFSVSNSCWHSLSRGGHSRWTLPVMTTLFPDTGPAASVSAVSFHSCNAGSTLSILRV